MTLALKGKDGSQGQPGEKVKLCIFNFFSVDSSSWDFKSKQIIFYNILVSCRRSKRRQHKYKFCIKSILIFFCHYLRNKTCSPCLHSLAIVGRIREHISKNPRRRGFSLTREFSQTFASVFTRLWRHGEHVLFLL